MTSTRPTILALDQAKTSGWAIWTPTTGKVQSAGTAKSAADRHQVVLEAQRAAHAAGGHLLVVHEDHSEIPASKRWPTPAVIGLGKALGRWLEQLEISGHPAAWILNVGAVEWRSKLIGNGHNREEAKRLACVRASRVLGRVVLEHEHDLAEAVCIAEWASLDGLAKFFGRHERTLNRQRARRAAARATGPLVCAFCGSAVPEGECVKHESRRGRMVWHHECSVADEDVRTLPWIQKEPIVKARGKDRVGAP